MVVHHRDHARLGREVFPLKWIYETFHNRLYGQRYFQDEEDDYQGDTPTSLEEM